MEVWLCDYASVITEPNFHAFSQTCWGFGHPRKGTTCCTVLNCRPFDFFNLLKCVSQELVMLMKPNMNICLLITVQLTNF